ncbi:electron transport complex subunit RsxC [Leadbettera azotonutricia]|uniref:Ion-translocating oxidoreductase complex subunit C n=1 Tax=Leadbettera azotonutricia (strain ATCC BAA-888 / DSM 13862 / ZAS-9) TaxID=545695 RepID=F5YEF2_LEAAZ|nr:electron transport complex subunit RsxC [Leadbettera azotonutricia]AEF80284.1 electron transport complex protein RnfC [Leadbettera azotonutricia ZAS-9]
MAVSTFKRGLRLNTRKHATEGFPVELAPLPKQVVIPINQHFGAPNKSLVNVGDKVKRGQRIAEGAAPGPMTVPVHASISGIVKKIENRLQSNNTEGPCIIIEAEEGVSDETDFMPPLDPFACTKEEALQRIRDAGITGMGGAGFPTHVKLSPPPNKPIDVIIADGAECEPYLTTDEALMTEKPDLLIKGLAIVMKLTGVGKAIIGMEDNKAKLIPMLEQELRLGGYGGDISLGLCRTLYPQGSEKLLIKALMGREVPSGGLPMDAGCIVSNVGSLVAIAEAFTLGKPLIDRDLTVSGGACKLPKNIRAPIGTILTDLPPQFMDIDYSKLRKVLFGGPMMGTAVPTLNIPIQKNTSGIILMTEEETWLDAEGPCLRCGRCIRNCSCKLSPVIMNNAIEAGDLDEAVKVGLMDCFECGACTYVCPARIKLTQRFRVGKQRLRLKVQAAQAAQTKAQTAAAPAAPASNAKS